MEKQNKKDYQITMWLPKIHSGWIEDEQRRLDKKGWLTIIKKRKNKSALFRIS